MSDIIDSIIGFVTNPFGIFDSSSKRGRMMALGNAPVPVNYPIFLQTDANGNISTFDFETQNFKALKISGDITSNGNLTVTGSVTAGNITSNGNLNATGNITSVNTVKSKVVETDNIKINDKGRITIGNGYFIHDETNGGIKYYGGPLNFDNGLTLKDQIRIGSTTITEDELQKLKTFINLRKSISSGTVKLDWTKYTPVFTLSAEDHNWGIFTIKSSMSMSQYKIWYISGIESKYELIQRTIGNNGNGKMTEFIDVICDGSGNVTAKSSTTYPDCTWTYERYY
jgi:hypothetical protein